MKTLYQSARNLVSQSTPTETGWTVPATALGELADAVREHCRRLPEHIAVDRASEDVADLAMNVDGMSNAEIATEFRRIAERYFPNRYPASDGCDERDSHPPVDYERRERVREFESSLGV